MKRAVLYMRVSTVDQHPETQLRDLWQLAQQRGYQIVAEHTDHIGGTKAKRPGLNELMADARRGRFDVVMVSGLRRAPSATFSRCWTNSTDSTSSSSASAKPSTPAARRAGPWS